MPPSSTARMKDTGRKVSTLRGPFVPEAVDPPGCDALPAVAFAAAANVTLMTPSGGSGRPLAICPVLPIGCPGG